MSDSIKEDFRNFMYLVWKHLKLPPPTPVQYEIAYWLQYGPSRQIIEAFRGVGKSWITSSFVLWTLERDPQAKFLVVSASKQRADDFSTFTLMLINDMPMLQHLKPRDDQRNSKIAFDVAEAMPAHAPSVKSAGIFGQMSGSRATHVIADDIEVPNNSATQDMREKLLKAVTEFEAIIVPEGGRITYLGTPQTEESLYNKLRNTRDYKCRIWPARVPSPAKLPFYEGALAPSIEQRMEKGEEGQATDPQRFTDMILSEREAGYGRSGFSLQFMLDTNLSDAEKYPLKLSDLIVMNLNSEKAPILVQYGSSSELQIKELVNPGFTGDRFFKPMYMDKEWTQYEGCVMTIDPSGRGADETTYAVVKQLHGFLYLVRCGGFKGGYEEETLQGLSIVAKHERVNLILVEENFGGGMFSKLLQPVLNRIHKCGIEEVHHSTQKEKRIIDTLEPVMNRHRLIVDMGLVEQDLELVKLNQKYSLLYQLTHLTKDRGSLKHDDRIDVLAMAISYWVDSMAQDEGTCIEDWKTRALDDELQQFMDGMLGQQVVRGKVRGMNWMNGMIRGTALEQRRLAVSS